MVACRFPIVAFAVVLSACAASPDGFEGAYDLHSGRYGEAMKAAVHAYEQGQITQAEMQERLSAAAKELALSDAATAQSEQRELSSYSSPPPPPAQTVKSEATPSSPAPAAGDTGNDCLLIPCPESPPPAANPDP